MQIVIPMSGFGERFRRAGYSVPKPLIEVDGKSIIGHVIDLFPGEADFIFICNEDHLANPEYRLEAILKNLCPTGRVVGIPAHKLGPIHAVRQIEYLLDPERPVTVNYCDFTCYWDWHHFKEFVVQSACMGAIPAYRGFHPHTLGTTNYAYLCEKDGWVSDVQEKQPFTNNRMEEFASSGTYYFASSKIMSEAFAQTMQNNMNIGGEFYVSLAYKALLAKHLPVAVYPLQHFMQWGTPDDLAEYNNWSYAFKRLMDSDIPGKASTFGSLVIPMAGLGKRFADEGYTITKPLIPVSGKSMAVQATYDLPQSLYQCFVLRQDMPGLEAIQAELLLNYPNAVIKIIPGLTEGQACTALIGLNALVARHDEDSLHPITFGACDNGVLFNANRYQTLLDNHEVDVIVWGVRGHTNAIRKSQSYGWIDTQANGLINAISVKKPLASPASDPIVIGTFTFRKPADAHNAINCLIARNGRINNEFYLDSCINDAIKMGLRCYLFEVDSFISWGTPDDLKTFEYWQSCFHKWAHHPYRLELDVRLAPAELQNLSARYTPLIPQLPPPFKSSASQYA